MFPIRDHNPSGSTPVVTWALIAMNIFVFIGYFGLFSDERALQAFFTTWGIVPARITAGEGYVTLLTSMFLHGGFMHVGGNMLFLWIFGDNLEDVLGHGRYLLFYLACGVAAALLQVAVAPGSTVPVVGASGAIAGVLGGYLMFYPRALVDILIIFVFYIRIITLPAWTMLGFWFVFQLIGGVTDTAGTGGVAHWAHTGGFVAGIVLCLPVWLRRGGPGIWKLQQGRPPHPAAATRFRRTNIPRVPRRSTRRGPWG